MRFSYRWFNGDIRRYAPIEYIEAYLRKRRTLYYVNDYLRVRYNADIRKFEGIITDTETPFTTDALYPLLKNAPKNNIAIQSFTDVDVDTILRDFSRNYLISFFVEVFYYNNRLTHCVEALSYNYDDNIITMNIVGDNVFHITHGSEYGIVKLTNDSIIHYDKSIFCHKLNGINGIIELLRHIYEDYFNDYDFNSE